MNDKLDLQTPDFVNENIEKLAALFPQCVTEVSVETPHGTSLKKQIDFDLLQQELSHNIVEGNRERYRLEWPGKREAIVTANLPTTKTLRPVREDSVDFDNTENLYIEGDNLEVLKLLQESYFGKIKMIYIDPPYNTGNDFVYRDNFDKDKETELFESGQIDEQKQRLVANPETSGRYHSDWLTMMYPRLKLARNLLTDDGAIFISIDDNEVHNLRKICDEIFGEGNFIANVIWQHSIQPKGYLGTFSVHHNHILIYKKSDAFILGSFERTDEDNKAYSNPDNDPNGPWRSGDVRNALYRPNLIYDIISPTGKIIKPCDNGWRWSKNTIQEKIKTGEIIFNEDETKIIRKIYLKNLEGRTPETLWFGKDVGTTRDGIADLKKIFDKPPFDTPKPINLLKRIMNLFSDNNDDIILDFFSGSATTAHAVMQLNAEDGGNRKYIMVQLPEQTDENSEAYKAGYKNICEIGKERIRRAGKLIVNGQLSMLNDINSKLSIVNGQLEEENSKLIKDENKIEQLRSEINELKEKINNLQLTINHCDTGFRVYRLADSNMQDVYYRPQDYKQENLDLFADNIKPDRTPDDLLAQVMLDWGLPLSYKIVQQTINGKQVFKVAQDSLLACFDKGIDEDFAKVVAKDKPLRVVFRDSGFASDTAKINVQQLLKQLSPDTEMKVI